MIENKDCGSDQKILITISSDTQNQEYSIEEVPQEDTKLQIIRERKKNKYEEINKKFNQLFSQESPYTQKIIFDGIITAIPIQYQNRLIQKERQLMDSMRERDLLRMNVNRLKIQIAKIRANIQGRKQAKRLIQIAYDNQQNFKSGKKLFTLDDGANLKNTSISPIKIQHQTEQQIKIRDEAFQSFKYYIQKQIERQKNVIQKENQKFIHIQQQKKIFLKELNKRQEEQEKRIKRLNQKAIQDQIANQKQFIKKLEKKIKKQQARNKLRNL